MEKSLLKSQTTAHLNNLFKFDQTFLTPTKTPLGFELCAYSHILGTDEAGRGPAAGEVYAGCVCFLEPYLKNDLLKLNDSKKISQKTREELFETIVKNSIYSIKSVDVETIEKINILNASLLAMKLAVTEVIEKTKASAPFVLVDGNKLIKDLKFPQKFIIKGDMQSASIAAASILAKVERDKKMVELNEKYPAYNWAKNKGYLTKEHMEAIKKFGITKHHRKSFLKNILKDAN